MRGWLPTNDYMNPPELEQWREIEEKWLRTHPRPTPPLGVSGKDFIRSKEMQRWIMQHKNLQAWADRKGIQTTSYPRARPAVVTPRQPTPSTSLQPKSLMPDIWGIKKPASTYPNKPPPIQLTTEQIERLKIARLNDIAKQVQPSKPQRMPEMGDKLHFQMDKVKEQKAQQQIQQALLMKKSK